MGPGWEPTINTKPAVNTELWEGDRVRRTLCATSDFILVVDNNARTRIITVSAMDGSHHDCANLAKDLVRLV